MANSSAQGVYTPLPQSISDSDSEKELQMDPIRPSFSNCKSHNSSFDQGDFTSNGCVLPMHRYDDSFVPKKLSTTRKIVFTLSICMCFLTIFVFLWGLPCNGTCPLKVSSWETQHEGIELKGEINVVRGVFENTHNLAVLFKKNLFVPNASNGVISILGSNGGVAWYISQAHPSELLNCSIIDVNGDDVLDCLLLGELGLEAVDPISGTIFWHARGGTKDKDLVNGINKKEFPVALPDFDGDMIGELLTTSKNNESGLQNKLVMFCGRTGLFVSQYELKNCKEVHIIKRIKDNIVYSCLDKNVSYYEVSLNDLRETLLYQSGDFEISESDYTGRELNVSILNKKKLVVDNTGDCPDCRANIALFDTVLDKELLTWSYGNTYVMRPEPFSFKSTKNTMASLKGHVNGFILKLWQWSEYETSKKQDVKYKQKFPMNNTVQNNINERVVLITFNDTNVHIINASLTPIVQLCTHFNETKIECQPDKNNQEDSLLITDIDGDNSQELISYSSSFIYHDVSDDKPNWQLISYMKVIRLEAELPKLYENTK